MKSKRLTVMVWFKGEGKWKWFAYVKCSTGDKYIKIGKLLFGWWWNCYLDGKEINPVTPM